MPKVVKIIVAVVLGLILILGFIIINPPAFLPHQRITISIPFDKKDPPQNLIPMGETIAHPKPQVPNGHPGIDIQWDHSTNILSSSDGEVSSIKQTPEHFNNWDLEVSSGVYRLRYKEMQDYNQDLKVGSKVKKGDFIGHPGHFTFTDSPGHYQIHWEFASASLILDRWCPMNYFDAESKKIMEEAWDKIPADNQFKEKFPYICSGDYFGKEEKS